MITHLWLMWKISVAIWKKQHFQVFQPYYLLTFQVTYHLKICCRERHTKSSKAQVIQSSAKQTQNPFEVFIFPNSFKEVYYESEKKKRFFNGYFIDAASFKKNLVVSWLCYFMFWRTFSLKNSCSKESLNNKVSV